VPCSTITPFSITTIRSHDRTVLSRCATNTAVVVNEKCQSCVDKQCVRIWEMQHVPVLPSATS
jgi:hypothetical protein